MADIKFSAQILNARNKWLALVSSETLDAGLELLRQKYGSEKNDNRRLANLAAQTWIIRRRLEQLRNGEKVTIGEFLENSPQKKSESSSQTKLEDQPRMLEPTVNEVASEEVVINEDRKIINISEEVVVNEMRFFAGSRVEVSSEDATRLVEAGKATLNE